ncbi:hypothetical protein NGY2020029_10170 [Vibrio cholerae]
MPKWHELNKFKSFYAGIRPEYNVTQFPFYLGNLNAKRYAYFSVQA